jgi:hypothetical protein
MVVFPALAVMIAVLSFNLLGDLLDGGELLFVEAVQTPEAARQRIEALAVPLQSLSCIAL